MPILDDLGAFLQAHGFGTLGQSIFLGSIPLDPPGSGVQDAVLGLFEIPGLPSEKVHDLLGPAVERARVQLRWRGTPYGYAAARTQAGNAFRLLETVVNQPINGVFYQQITALQSPFALPSDEWQRPSILFEIICARDGQAP
jgi:hypothetical protein